MRARVRGRDPQSFPIFSQPLPDVRIEPWRAATTRGYRSGGPGCRSPLRIHLISLAHGRDEGRVTFAPLVVEPVRLAAARPELGVLGVTPTAIFAGIRQIAVGGLVVGHNGIRRDRKSTRLNSSH